MNFQIAPVYMMRPKMMIRLNGGVGGVVHIGMKNQIMMCVLFVTKTLYIQSIDDDF